MPLSTHAMLSEAIKKTDHSRAVEKARETTSVPGTLAFYFGASMCTSSLLLIVGLSCALAYLGFLTKEEGNPLAALAFGGLSAVTLYLLLVPSIVLGISLMALGNCTTYLKKLLVLSGY